MAFSQESFGIECGCSGDSSETADVRSTPAPASANGSTPASGPSPSPSPAGGLSCGADSFRIISPQLDDFEGCFADTDGVNGTLSSHYGQTSSELGDGGGTNSVFAASIDERGHQVHLFWGRTQRLCMRWRCRLGRETVSTTTGHETCGCICVERECAPKTIVPCSMPHNVNACRESLDRSVGSQGRTQTCQPTAALSRPAYQTTAQHPSTLRTPRGSVSPA